METFTNSDDFFDWYLKKIKSFVPNLDSLVEMEKHQQIIDEIPKLTPKQVKYTIEKIREIAPIADGVEIRYNPEAPTWYSTIDNKKYIIGIPVYAYYMTRYPPVITAGVEHELGHILNGDLERKGGMHHKCLNITQDCRINDHINRNSLKDLYNSTYWFKTFSPEQEDDNLNVPEFFYPKIGLPYRKGSAGYSYKHIHEAFHRLDVETEPYTEQPEVGDIVQIRKGDNSGKFGEIISMGTDGKFTIQEMTSVEVSEYFKKNS